MKEFADPAIRRLMAIFGAGRSGSTWLGAIVGSHPEVAYRFEPIHRLAAVDSDIRILRSRLASGDFGSEMLEELYARFLPAHAELEKPPFFEKSYRTQLSWGRSVFWPIARTTGLLAGAFRWLYTPRDFPPLVFKEVSFDHIMRSLLERTSMRVVYLMRHPAALVHSQLAGQGKSLMPTARRSVLENYVRGENPELLRRLRIDVNSLTSLEIEVLLLRLDMDVGWRAAQASPHALIVVYEELCQRPFQIAQQVFEHFELDFAESSRRFIQMSMGASRWSRLRHGEIGIDPYFSVFRDPRDGRDRWKKEMPLADQTRVLELLEGSQAFQAMKSRGIW